MKTYISVDIEGVSGIQNREETRKNEPDHAWFAEQMTREASAACKGALNSGADDIWIKDGHGTGRNIKIEDLPSAAKLIRGWSGHPLSMMQELDGSFDAAMMVGYHSRAGSAGNPLSHTKTGTLSGIAVNGRPASEFVLNAFSAAYFKVPVVFISGDSQICKEAGELIPAITAVEAFTGRGASSLCLHPSLVAEGIQQGVEKALSGNRADCLVELPASFEVDIAFVEHHRAYRASFYPGMTQIDSRTVRLSTDDWLTVLSALMFVVY